MRAILLTAALLVAPAAQAHEDGAMHYPPECCHNMDCAPVDKVEVVPAMKYAGLGFQSKAPSITVITTKHGTVAVPDDFQRRRSEDGRMHACIRAGAMGQPRLVCFFEPPAM